MKKVLFAILMCGLVGFSTLTKAQSGRLSIGVDIAQPMGDFGDQASTGFGGSARYELPMGDKIGLTLTAGYLTFSGKDEGGFEFPNVNIIPVQVGAKYYFSENQKGLYAAAEVGIHSTSVDIEGAESSTDFSYAPEVGFHMAHIDLGLRYQFISGGEDASGKSTTSSYLGLRAAWAFGGE
jgi:hypothetical protein